MQNFVGQGAWDDEAVMAELRRHVTEELCDPDAVLVIDPSTFPKKGTESCGVVRAWVGSGAGGLEKSRTVRPRLSNNKHLNYFSRTHARMAWFLWA